MFTKSGVNGPKEKNDDGREPSSDHAAGGW